MAAMPNTHMPDTPEEPDPIRADLASVTQQEVVEALAYALRYDERGKPHRGSWDLIANLAAERLAEHLRRSGLVIMRARSGRPHTAG
jgi:hypothetical protein